MMKYEPLVSIIIPVYNGSNYLRTAINSALSQSYPNIEVLVINDGSTDHGKTEEIATAYGKRIRYFFKKNGGVASALNYGIREMKGEYVSWLSHDDVYLPEKIEKEVEMINSLDNRNSIVFSAYQTIDENGHTLDEYHMPENVYSNIAGLISIDTERTLNGCTMLIPRDILGTDPFNEELRYTQDYDLWLRLLRGGIPYVYLDQCLFLSRQHPMQDSRAAGEKVIREADQFRTRSVSLLSAQAALDYVNGSIGELERTESCYRANGYFGTALAMKLLIARCRSLKNGKDTLVSWDGFLGLSRNTLNTKQLFEPTERKTMVLYSNVWTFGGIERVLSKLIPAFEEKQWRVILVSNHVPGEKGYPLSEKTVHVYLREQSDLLLTERLTALCYLTKADVFIGNPNIIEEFLPVYDLLYRFGIRSVALNHYYYFLPYTLDWLRPVAEARHKAFQYADAVIWLTQFSGVMCAKRCDHVAVIPDPNTYEAAPPRTLPTQKTILVVGRFFDSLKRIDRVMQVFGELYRRDGETRLVVLGNCHELSDFIPLPVNMSIKEAMEKEGIPSEAVTFAGEQKDVRGYYEQASVLLMASECEGFSMVLTEAGVYGVPVVVYGTPGLEDIITDGENGYIVSEGKPELAAERILDIMDTPELWLKMSRAAQKLAERFSMDNVIRKWDALFAALFCEDSLPMSRRLSDAGLSPIRNVSVDILYSALEQQNRILQNSRTMVPPMPEAVPLEVTSNPELEERIRLDEMYRREVMLMQQSLSWRITKPLRWFKKHFMWWRK